MGTTTYPDYYGNTTVPIQFSGTLPPGSCVAGGYIYCHQGNEADVRTNTKETINKACCKNVQDTNCLHYLTDPKDNSYTCSYAYSNNVYAKYALPYYKDYCGGSNVIALNKIGDNATYNLTL